ncbi:MAG: ParB/RepB/Spo0J family partition protein [Patescibacteria group bacterium]|jgi:ParB family chromosome partitioning protein|nr:ParB/RepB/Spo0J family partition protein [Patescibacteria group bacterium]
MQDVNTDDSKKMARHGLGRGLDSLIPTEEYENGEKTDKDSLIIQIDKIDPNPHQPRKDFNEEALVELASSIREHGILQPLLVTPAKDRFQLIAGERRLRAAKIVGLTEVSVIVRTMGEQSKLELALIENVQREDLNPIETAQSYKQLIDEFNLKQEDLSKKVGKARATIANTLRLLSLPAEIKLALSQNQITEGHARALLAVDDKEKQRVLFEKILKGDVTVREAESHAKAKRSSHAPEVKDPNFVAAEKRMAEVMGTKVEIKNKKNKGQIVIDYYSFEDLERIFKRIINS